MPSENDSSSVNRLRNTRFSGCECRFHITRPSVTNVPISGTTMAHGLLYAGS